MILHVESATAFDKGKGITTKTNITIKEVNTLHSLFFGQDCETKTYSECSSRDWSDVMAACFDQLQLSIP